MGYLYHHGEGVEKDYKEALKWYKEAIDLGGINAAYNIGLIYNNGAFGVEKDYKLAREWYMKASEDKHSNAMYYLGLLYHQGNDDVGKDYAEALKWYAKAMDVPPAQVLRNNTTKNRT